MTSRITTTRQNDILTVRDAVRVGMHDTMISDLKTRISEAALFRGMSIPAKDLDVMARMYLSELEQYFPDMDLVEVRTVLRSGIRKEYGEFYGLSAGTLYDWTCAYMRSPQREQYVRMKREHKNEGRLLARRNEKSEADIFAVLRDKVNRQYAAYCRMREGKQGLEDVLACDGQMLAIAERAFPETVGKKKYPVWHPLCDLGGSLSGFLHGQGFTGSLKDIFEDARAQGKEVVL